MLFATIFRVLPEVVLGWRDVFAGRPASPGAVRAFGRALIAITCRPPRPRPLTAGSLLVLLLLWVNYLVDPLLFGAAFTRAYLRRARPDGAAARATAVLVHRQLIDD